MNRYIRASLAMLACVYLCGCSTAQPLGIRPGTLGVLSAEDLGRSPAQTNDEGTSEAERIVVNGLIVVGRVTDFQAIEYDEFESVYKGQYLAFYEKWHGDGDPALSMGQFANTIGGFTKIAAWRFNGLGLIGAQKVTYALVPNRLEDGIQVPSVVDRFFWTGTSDLVAAKTNDDGVFVIKRVLCQEGPEFDQCSKGYAKGLFEATTGTAIDEDLKPITGGPSIDIESFVKLDRVVGPTL